MPRILPTFEMHNTCSEDKPGLQPHLCLQHFDWELARALHKSLRTHLSVKVALRWRNSSAVNDSNYVEQGSSRRVAVSLQGSRARSFFYLFCVNIDIYIVNLKLHRPIRIKRLLYQKECQVEAYCAHSVRKTNQNLPFGACCGGRLTIVVCARSTNYPNTMVVGKSFPTPLRQDLVLLKYYNRLRQVCN
jgi:hypothetical protein